MSFVTRTISLHRPNHYVNEDPSGILFNRHFNKGTAFTTDERNALRVRGLLPHRVEDISTQVRRCVRQLRSFESPIAKYNYLSALRERSDTLFYRLVMENLRECLPLIYTPTVGQACLEFGLQYRAAEGMYISQTEKGMVRQILENWKPNTRDEVAIIVITDGSRILGLGDLGANGMGIPIGKLSLYVAAAGFHPASTLPIVLDAGTNNEELLNDEFYLGARHKRLPDSEYYPLMDELLMAIKAKWPSALVQFEDFSNDHCFELLDRYRSKIRCFNDDIQGTGAVIAAGFLSAIQMSPLDVKDHRILVFGAGSAGIGVVNMICAVLETKFGIAHDEARRIFYLMDSQGLVATTRSKPLQDFKVPFARSDVPAEHLKDVVTLDQCVDYIKPTGLIGLAGAGPVFTPEILRKVAQNTEHPIIFPLSNPTTKSECTAEAAFTHTDGKCIFASGSPFPDVTLADGRVVSPSQGNNMYIFPGLGFGAWLGGVKSVSEEMIVESSVALADLVTPEMRLTGQIYPPLENIRAISKFIAARVIQRAHKQGLIDAVLPAGLDLESTDAVMDFVGQNMYDPSYLEWNPTTGQIVKPHATPLLTGAAHHAEVKELDL